MTDIIHKHYILQDKMINIDQCANILRDEKMIKTPRTKLWHRARGLTTVKVKAYIYLYQVKANFFQ